MNEKASPDRVFIFDTTLRDGEQSPGFHLDANSKLRIARQLEKLGVDVIEAGFPISSPGDFEACRRIAREIRGVTVTALARAVRALPELPQHVFVDGRDKIDAPCDCAAVIGGDGIVMSIAAASIIAKVTRDRLMCALAKDCPGYGFETHKGYAVPEHREALDRLGPSIHHRRFFAPVIAAREKHQPSIVEPDLFTVETHIVPGISVAV